MESGGTHWTATTPLPYDGVFDGPSATEQLQDATHYVLNNSEVVAAQPHDIREVDAALLPPSDNVTFSVSVSAANITYLFNSSDNPHIVSPCDQMAAAIGFNISYCGTNLSRAIANMSDATGVVAGTSVVVDAAGESGPVFTNPVANFTRAPLQRVSQALNATRNNAGQVITVAGGILQDIFMNPLPFMA